MKGLLTTAGEYRIVEKGATITFTTPNYGLAFYTGQRAEDTA